MSEVRHSLDCIKVEVFAEPNSNICVYGSKQSIPTSLETSSAFSKYSNEMNNDESYGKIIYFEINNKYLIISLLDFRRIYHLISIFLVLYIL